MQVVVKDNGVRHIVEHLGSAHDEAEPAALMRLGHQRLLAGQQVLDLGPALDGGGQAPSHEPGDGGIVASRMTSNIPESCPSERLRSHDTHMSHK